jgi:diguanylate cyclase (GGDEF)-like protein
MSWATPPVILADVDWAIAYNDAYGHQQGDLMLARVHACLEAAASRAGARCLRVGGDELAVLVEEAGAARLAEELRREVEAMEIPFEHPGVRTHGRVTVSVAVAAPRPNTALRGLLEDTVDEAKRAGRNRVVCR